ncbi:hypothetical protein PpBr36_08582 [Pyricularia pennisetigena]|uniref:hypothetical protein n=1 Tax=Pyricularia pennisetigena TaxID=1578925 RepID=UPI00114F6C31|nr:hypothetical protein PpBr36_08582 [Pyricularia pennisetigena]TLS24051.1 hypothetical protein PpBr36_08582 [Pyricularia pennisetigena]
MDTRASYRTLVSRSLEILIKRQGTNVTRQGHATELILDTDGPGGGGGTGSGNPPFVSGRLISLFAPLRMLPVHEPF